ncbi:hypothetical protein HMPREF9630_02150 [Peptoanaerobacter stomatis]|uniref:SLH domain-containing protein n=1 Tax=Peptoanaerobacter stomatis TaxID=796937 RepID=U6Q1X8_9FIRM|nr:FMN-binding protein [Peptoanaerobacter stomatis]EJZ44290.1 hypothetical protein HMPREF9630_02150 [Peptoanaerobacter stomatis]
MKRKRIALALSLIMILTSINIPLSQAQSDIENHWAKQTITKWQQEGLLKGDKNGNINPDNNITRAEFITLINKALGYNKTGDKIKTYKDIKQTDWYYSQIMTAIEQGYINGTSKDTISPGSNITRQEVMTIINKIANPKSQSQIDKNQIKDIEKTSSWAKQSVQNMIENGYIAGYQNQINPTNKMTRAEAITLIEAYKQNNRTLSFKGEYNLGQINNLTILTGDITIKDTQIQDLIIDKQAKGKIQLQNVQIKGKIQNNSSELQIIQDKEENKQENKQEQQKYKDGQYEGKAKGYASDIKVKVTIEKGKISKIEVIEQKEDQIYWNQAKKVIDRIIEKQDIQVDVSAGATISSKGIMYAVQDALGKAENKKEETKAQEEYKDGEYIGEANGFSGTVKVKVTIKDKKIEQVEVISHSDDTSYMDSAKNIIQDIKRKQKAEVEVISGATYSSNGIINATKDALEQAKGKTTKPGQSEYAIKNMDGGASTAGGSGSAGAKQETDFTDLKDGEYEGIASGYYTNSIKVKVTVSAGKITKIEVTNGDDKGYLTKEKEEKLIKSIIDNQSTKVDTMSGATYSSRGVINAVVNALSGAKTVLSILSNNDAEEKLFDGENKTQEIVEIERARNNNEATPNVKVQNMTISKKLTIKDSMRDGTVTFENVTVNGDILIQGGGEHSVYFKNCTLRGTVTVDKQIRQRVNVVFDENTKVNGKLVLKTPAIVNTKGNTVIPNLELSSSLGNNHQTAINANVTKLDVKTTNANILIDEDSKVGNINLPNSVQRYENNKTTYTNQDGTFKLEIKRPENINNGSNTNPSMRVVYGYSNVDQVKYPSVAPFIHPPFYDMRVKVVLDSSNRIISVSNDETGVKGLPEGVSPESWSRHERYWNRMIAGNIFDKFTGKTLVQVKAMQMDKGQPDVVTGATANSLAMKQAVINAIEGKKGRGFLTSTQTLKAVSKVQQGVTIVNFTNTLPNDFKIKLLSVAHTVYNGEQVIQGVTLNEDGTVLTIPNNLKAGHYYVNILDDSNSYRSPDFEGGVGENGHYPYFVVKSNATLSFADDKLTVSDGDLKNVYDNIEHIIITDVQEKASNPKYRATEIEPIGHHGTKGRTPVTVLFDENTGELKHNAKISGRGGDTPIFKYGKQYKIEVEAFGYNKVEIDYVANKTNKILTGDANVDQVKYPFVDPFIHPPFFNARVIVELDSDGKIISVKDNKTGEEGLAPGGSKDLWNRRNKRYWDKAVTEGKIFDKFKDKTLAEVEAMQMDTGGADVVSGATANSLAIKQAVINAINEKNGKLFLKSDQTLTANPLMINKTTSEVMLTNTLPNDFDIELIGVIGGVYNSTTDSILGFNIEADGTKLTIPDNLKAGHYYINIIDRSQKYRSPDFESGHGTPVHYPYFVIKNDATLGFTNSRLTVSDNDLENVLKNIKEIVVKDKSRLGEAGYEGEELETVGHHGTVDEDGANFFNKDGSINLDTKSWIRVNGKWETRPMFEIGKEYQIEVDVWGFENKFIFDYTASNILPPPAPLLVEKFGEAEVEKYRYTVKLKVVLDSDNKVVSVEDNGTNTRGNNRWWKRATAGLFSKFVGKTLSQVEAMNVERRGADVVSSATYTSKALKQAVINAFNN